MADQVCQPGIAERPLEDPGGSDMHYGIVHYGTDRKDLSQTAKNPIRLNRASIHDVPRAHSGPQATDDVLLHGYSAESNGTSDGVKSTVSKFTTPGPGKRIVTRP